MTWAKFAAEMPEHPKLTALEPATKWLFVEIVCYCNRQLTDGYITPEQVRRLDVAMQGPPDASGRQHGRSNGRSNVTTRVAALQAVGLLEVVSTVAATPQRRRSEGGSDAAAPQAVDSVNGHGVCYHVHDFEEYQPTRAEVLAQNAAGRLRAQRSRERRANGADVRSNARPRSPDPVRSVPKDKEVTARARSPERTSARPPGGSRSPVTVHEVLTNGRLRLQVQPEAPPLPDDPPDDLDPPDDEAEP